jgi:surface polysaccharide O-acyltransferase-like enzyme
MPTTLAAHKHLWLLIAMVLAMALQPLIVHAPVGARILSSAVSFAIVLFVLLVALERGWQRWLGAALFVPATIIELTHYAFAARDYPSLASAYHICLALFLALVVSLIVRNLFHKPRPAVDDIIGAFTGYLIFGLFWAQLYVLAWLLIPDAFSIDPRIAWQLDEWHTRRALFEYFSFATQASVGYADITTTSPATNTFAWMEVMFAQFYLAVVVGAIVGMKLAQSSRSREEK